ncbi:hypothetical protein FJQ98_11600 [Lysinibacillus agricola]|uniref:Uncharacterized protein n=1 Tax=Lysinibacillus agricola TaxID=2590012 RepID=A0ABX7AX97_9BACI|nr:MULTISPECIES: hypothetical protein [Lysinibacillus]KOS60294.1 hypothetical protein AN161_24715 [Lysinibacillus sp. FJAT-14222]QQP14588.1 hypothetical protein FJQ98_11600 [Lysinibacillus agricola]
MDQIRNAINEMYKEGKFSHESHVKTFQKINQKTKRQTPLTPIILTVVVSGCLLISLKLMLSQNDFQSTTSAIIDSNLYPEKSGKFKDYSVLKRPWMVVGLASTVSLFIFALFALMKKWFWRVLLCIIIMIAILGNMSERIGYRVYVQNEAEIQNAIKWGPFHPNTVKMNDTITIQQYRIGYFSENGFQGISIFKHNGKGYALDFFIQSELDTMTAVYLKDIHYIVIPLLENHNIEKLIIDTDAERMEIAVDSNVAQLVSVPFKSEIATSQLVIHALDHEGKTYILYNDSKIFTY